MFFTEEKCERYLDDLQNYIYQKEIPLKDFKYKAGAPADAYRINLDDQDWILKSTGDSWGGKDVVAWFRNKVIIPTSWGKDEGDVVLDLNLGRGEAGGLGGAESLLYINEKPVQGLDRNHHQVFLNSRWLTAGELLIAIKAFSGLQKEQHQIKKASLGLINRQLLDFYYRIFTILKTIKTMSKEDYNRSKLTQFLNNALNDVDFREPGSEIFYKTIAQANFKLKEQLLTYNNKTAHKPEVYAVGHSHIDVAWLWRLQHTREKCSRTFSTVLQLMEEYPEYTFLQSSPLLYQFIKEDYPEIYQKIKEKVAEGKWEVTGGMWVEADCNLPSGESLVRQFMFGTRFIKEEFGLDSLILWLPDAFGYSWALPQIIEKSGLKYFMTTKISWCQFNRPEYDTFKWRGLDGTEALTHFITTPYTPHLDELNENNNYFYDYNGDLTPASVQGCWQKYQQKDINDKILLAYGHGDGGGGPTRDMIEIGKKLKELPGIPRVNFSSGQNFYRKLEEEVGENSKLPVWDDELYLEFHRGTYTSQADIKKYNRLCEILYHNLELYNSWASKLIDGFQYPQQQINAGWKLILRNQFHDIITGTSIKEVYQDSKKEYDRVIHNGRKMLNNALKQLAGNINLIGEKLVVFNPLGWDRSGTVIIPWQESFTNKCFVTSTGQQLFSKKINEGNDINKKLLIYVSEVPASGYRAFRIVDEEQLINASNKDTFSDLKISPTKIENKYYQIKLNNKGQIISIFDKEAIRQILPEGKIANCLQAFEDRPMNWDAWDIDIYYQEKEYEIEQLIERKILENGPDRAVLYHKWKFLDSEIRQKMIVYADKRRIDFKTEVDWHQQQVLLKTAFPVDVRTTKATYEIQFGNIERSTHWNTSRDYAKFETVAQKWADLSERDYGVSLLNDCKYGYDIKDQVMRLTLLKSGTFPDPDADQGLHSFTYSLYPHRGDWFTGKTTEAAHALNFPLLGVPVNSKKDGELPVEFSFIKMQAESVILDTVKQAEDDNSLILRFYEYGNKRDQVQVKFPVNIKDVMACNLMEKNLNSVKFDNNGFEFNIAPYEIKTFKVEL